MKDKSSKVKSSLLRILIAFLLLSSWVVIGVVLALENVNIKMGGIISFESSDVSALITGSMTGTKTTHTFSDITLDTTTTEEELTSMQESWSGWDVKFNKSTNKIVVTFKIENTGSGSIWVEIADGVGSNDNVTITRQYVENAGTSTTTDSLSGIYEVAGGEYLQGSVTLVVKNLNKRVENLTFEMDIDLTNEDPERAPDASQYSDLAFTYDETGKTATVRMDSSNSPAGG